LPVREFKLVEHLPANNFGHSAGIANGSK